MMPATAVPARVSSAFEVFGSKASALAAYDAS